MQRGADATIARYTVGSADVTNVLRSVVTATPGARRLDRQGEAGLSQVGRDHSLLTARPFRRTGWSAGPPAARRPGRRGRPLRVIPGQVPDLSKPQDGCRFKERCAYRIAQCDQAPALSEISPSQAAACWKRGNYRPGGDRRD